MWLSWLELLPAAERLRARFPVQARPEGNQQMFLFQIVVMLSLSSPLSKSNAKVSSGEDSKKNFFNYYSK